MKKNFVIQNGDLSFEDDYISIDDNNKRWTKFFTLFGSVCIILYGIIIFIKYFTTHDNWDLWPGIICVIFGIPSLIYRARTNYDRRIEYSRIEKVIIKHNFTNFLIASFILKDSTTRRATLDQNDLAKFEKFSLGDLVKALNDKSISTEIQN
jgi:hypothetical protein